MSKQRPDLEEQIHLRRRTDEERADYWYQHIRTDSKTTLTTFTISYLADLETARREAVREFAERVKGRVTSDDLQFAAGVQALEGLINFELLRATGTG